MNKEKRAEEVMRYGCAFFVLALNVWAFGAERPFTLVTNGGFEKGTSGWSAPAKGVKAVPSPRGGQCVEVKDEATVWQNVFVGPKAQRFTVAVDLKAEGITPAPPAGYAYAAVYQLNLRGEMVAFRDFVQVRDRAEWKRYFYTFDLAPGAEIISLRCGIYNAQGLAWFDNWTLVEGKKAMSLEEVAEPQPYTGHENGVVGIFRQEGFSAKGIASSPDVLAEILRGSGVEVKFLDVAGLSDPTTLRPSNYDVVILPYGESFPAAAREAFIHYLRTGGDFISMGGYAFNNLLHFEEGRWVSEKDYLARRLEEALKPDKSLLFDGGFEKDETKDAPIGGKDVEARWHRSSHSCIVVEEQPREGQRCAKVEAASASKGSEVKWDLHLPAQKGRVYRVSAWVRTRAVQTEGVGFAYAALYQYDAQGKLIKAKDFAQVKGTSEWAKYEYDFTPEPASAVIYIKCGLYQATGTAWFDDVRLADITGLQPRPMNTSTGVPRDGLEVSPMQIGVFDADYRLKRVHHVKAAPGQHIFPSEISFGSVKGWAASGVRGMDQTRWIPLLMSYDRYGRERGSAGSLLIHYSGPFSGSAWAYFGVESEDLFTGANSIMNAALLNLVRFMVRGVYLRNLCTDFTGYDPGSTVRLEVVVENRGCRRHAGAVRFIVLEEKTGKRLLDVRKEVGVDVGSSSNVSAEFVLPPDVVGLCVIRAELEVDGRIIDEMESAFVAFAPLAEVGQPPLRFRNNYFSYGERPIFLFGCDNYSNVYKSTTEGPLWWAREHAACRDFGFEIYENLQYSNPGHRMEEADWRNFRAMAQLTQHYGLVFMPGLLIGHNVAVSDEQIAEESRQCEGYAQRLKDTPKLLWYINGDYQLRHNDLDALKKKWNAYLKEKYGSTQRLKEAWGAEFVEAEIGDLPFPPKNSDEWDDVRQIDLHLFHVKLMTDWNQAHVKAIRAHDTEHPITSEYYQRPFWGIDLRLTIDGQDVSNIGFFAEPEKDIDLLPLQIRWNDLRAYGKSVSLGEYGVKTHPAWTVENGAYGYHIVRTQEEQKQLFMAVAHYAFGLGASKVQNWCLRDADQRVFPWGVFYPGPLIPKDVAYIHRNLSLLMRMFAPQYEPPALSVLLCDNMRLGNHPNLGTESGRRCFAALLGLHVDFNVLSDWFVNDIPAYTKVIIYPSALCAGDQSMEGLARWVEAGGRLLVTGDFGHDEHRKHTRAERLKRLAGVEWVATNYAPEKRNMRYGQSIQTPAGPLTVAPMAKVRPAGAQVLAAASNGDPVLTLHRYGKGLVYFLSDPLELAGEENAQDLLRLYDWFLKEAGVESIQVMPDEPDLHVFEVKTRTGRAHVVFDYRKGTESREVALKTAAGPVSLSVKNRYPALVSVSKDGAVRVVGGFRSAKIGAEEILTPDGMATLVALDGADLRRSEAAMVLPFTEGRVSWRAGRAWREPVILLGEIHHGGFRILESLKPDPGNYITIDFDADRATLFALVCEADARTKWVEFIGELASHPERFPGY